MSLSRNLRLKASLGPQWFKLRCLHRQLGTNNDKMIYDVVTVGGGPAGLSTAIRLKQQALRDGVDISVCVLEKGNEIGAHIISGNVFEPTALSELLPDWKLAGAPIKTAVTEDHLLWLSKNSHVSIPEMLVPKQLHNNGNYIISLSQLTRWLASQAELLGVEIYPGFAASKVIYNNDGHVCGVGHRVASTIRN